jgi:hypothetical protein
MTVKAIVCFVLVLVLTGLALLQLRSIRLGLASREWNVARGRIVRAFVDDDGSDGEGGELLHSANVRYVYRVGRREYASSRLSYGSTRHLKFDEAIRMLHGIVQGREVDVYFDPRKPDRSVLIQGIARGDIARCSLSFLLAAAVAVWSW